MAINGRLANGVILSGGASFPIGAIIANPGPTLPSGWLLCDGAAHSRTTYADLFAEIGEDYGAGNGTTTFNVPNVKGRSLMGVDAAGSGEIPTARAQQKGAATHTLTEAQLPAHGHGYTGPNASYGVTSGSDQFATTTGAGATTNNAGSGNAHNSVHPVLGVDYIIYAGV